MRISPSGNWLSMSQESWKIETDETEYQTPETPILCANNCGFFGSAVTNNLCSKCYRDFIMKQQAMVAPVVPLVEKSHSVASSSIAVDPCSDFCNEKGVIHPMTVEGEEVEDLMNKKPANRCFLCRKKVGLTGFKCRCGETYCSVHRYADTHKCNFDYKSAGREAIAKENPVVKAEKIEKI